MTSVKLTWDVPVEPNGIITKYFIHYTYESYDNFDIETHIIQTGSATTEYNITGLEEFWIYNFTVYPATVVGNGTRASDVLSVQTQPDGM